MIFSEYENSGKTRLENRTICAVCGGECCQKMACSCSPKDFDNDCNKMEEALKSGHYSIDLHRCDLGVFAMNPYGVIRIKLGQIMSHPNGCLYIRARNVNRPIVDFIHEKDEEGPCIFWNPERGCSLPYEKRPHHGRNMIPNIFFECDSVYGEKFLEVLDKEWKPYTQFLYEM